MGASWLTIRLARQSTSVEIATSEVVTTIAFAIASAAVLTFLVDLLAHRLIYKPIEQELKDRNEQLIDSYQRVFGLREQLASAEQLAAVGQTAANVAHQVGTPLNLISGYVQVLKEELGAASPLASRLAIIEEQVAKVTSTVRTLLDRSRHMGRKTRSTAGEIVAHVCEAM